MPFPDIPANEAARLAALRALQVLDTAPEPAYDDIVRLAAQVCGTSMATITLIDEHRQWHKSALGTERGQCPREDSFCGHTVLEDDLLIINDTAADARFSAHPLVLGEPHIRFYAGAPLHLGDGLNLGALCVFDREPHTITADQQESLRALSRQVAANLTLGRTVVELEKAARERDATESALRASEAQFRLFMDNAPMVVLMKDADGRFLYVNRMGAERFQIPAEEWIGKTDADLFGPRTAKPWRAADLRVMKAGRLAVLEEEVLTSEGTQTWISHKFPVRNAAGEAVLAVLSLDITARRRSERERERLVIELRQALAEVKTLSGLIPICVSCKNIRDDTGYWQLIEGYIAEHSEAEFSHSLCPECLTRLHPDYAACLGVSDPPPDVRAR